MSKQRSFRVGNLPAGKDWLAGGITSADGHLSYHVTLEDGRVGCRHKWITSDLLDYPQATEILHNQIHGLSRSFNLKYLLKYLENLQGQWFPKSLWFSSSVTFLRKEECDKLMLFIVF